MSFKCQGCSNTFPNKESPEYRPTRVVTETRKILWSDGSSRDEIAGEKEMCTPCASSFMTLGPPPQKVVVVRD